MIPCPFPRKPTGALCALAAGLALFIAGASAQTISQATMQTPPAAAEQTPAGVPGAVTGSETGSLVAGDQAIPSMPAGLDAVLSSGDQISLRLFSDPDYTFSGRISTDGTVLLPLIGSVPLRGLNVAQAEESIAQRLQSAGMYRDPQVILTVTEGLNTVVTLGGEMHADVPVIGSRSLYSVISAGGGLPNTASRTVQILRPGRPEPISVELGTDPAHERGGLVPVFPGDTVLVHHLGVLYVAGDFHSPGVVQMTNYSPLTLSQVSAIVGGPIWDAKYDALHIIRTVGDHRTVTTLNIKDVLYGKQPDPIMQPNDIVFLPPSPIKSSFSNGSFGSILGLASFALATIYALR